MIPYSGRNPAGNAEAIAIEHHGMVRKDRSNAEGRTAFSLKFVHAL
jgi:hypothetical protein